MKLSLLFISFHAASSFKLSDFAKVPPELLLLHNDTDADDIDIVDTVINIAANAANVIGDKVKEAKNNKESTNEHEVPLQDNTEDSQEPKEIIDIVEENTSSEILAEETLLKEEDKEAAQEEASEQEENDANKVEVKESLSKEEDQEGENDVEDLKESIKKQVLLETEEKYLTTLKPVPDENLAPDLKLQDSLIDLKSDPDKCPMDDSSDKFQMKLYWTKGTEWQGSKKEKAWCAECNDSCKSGNKVRIKECDDRDKKQFWIFENCSVKPASNPDVCFTSKSGYSGEISLETCTDERKKRQQFRLFDPQDIFEKFQFKLLHEEKKNDKICLSQWHHPTSGEKLKFFSCKKAFMNDNGTKKKDDTSHWVIGDFDGHRQLRRRK